jgi:hypothetical protein
MLLRDRLPLFGFGVLCFSFITVLTSFTVLQMQSVAASSLSPYDSGHNHGCSDARISDPSDRYINEPGKGPSHHTNEFMRGYNAGYNACSSFSGGGGSGGGGGVGSVSGGTYPDGDRNGKAKGERDALAGRPFNDRCSGPTNEYCLGYKVGYGWEYRITKALRGN